MNRGNMSNIVVQLPKPCYHLKHDRFTKRNDWRLRDLSLSLNGEIVLSGGNENTNQTYIDVYSATSDYTDKPNLLYSKEFSKVSSGTFSSYVRRVSFVENDSDKIVTCIGDILELIQVRKEAVLKRRKVNGDTMCLSVTDCKIFVGFYKSNKIRVYNVEDLNEINSILLKGIQSGDFPFEVTVATDKLFACVGQCGQESTHRPLLFDERSGSILSEFTHPTGGAWYAWGLTVSDSLGIVAVVWSDSFHVGEGHWQVVFYSLKSVTESLLMVAVESGVSKIEISDEANRMATRNYVTGDVRMHDMAAVNSYVNLKKKLASFLTRDDCRRLITYFSLSDDQRDRIMGSGTPVEALFLVLEENGYVQTWDVDKLAEAFLKELPIKSICHHAIKIYQRTRSSSFYKERIRKTEDELKIERVKSENTVQHLLDALETANKKAEDQKREIKGLLTNVEQCCLQLSRQEDELKVWMDANKGTEEALQETRRKLEVTQQLLQNIIKERDLIREEHRLCPLKQLEPSLVVGGLQKSMQSSSTDLSNCYPPAEVYQCSLGTGLTALPLRSRNSTPRQQGGGFNVETNHATEQVDENQIHSFHGVDMENLQQRRTFHNPSSDSTEIQELGARPTIPGKRETNVRGCKSVGNTLMPYQHRSSCQTDMEVHALSDHTMLAAGGFHTTYNTLLHQNYHNHYHNSCSFGAQPISVGSMYAIKGNGDGDESQRNPFRYGILQAIAGKLDPVHALGNDWKQLADQLGFTMEDLEKFEAIPGSSTVAVISCAVKRGKLQSLHQLKSILQKMERADAVAVIPNEESNE